MNRIVYPPTDGPLPKYRQLLRSALWASESGTLEAAAELDEDSPWLRYIPLDERRAFLQKVFLESQMSGVFVSYHISSNR